MALTIKEKKPGQRACDEKDSKGKVCVGHLKRWWYPADSDVAKELGPKTEIYRCERCHALYRPSPNDDSSAGLRYVKRTVNILGDPVGKG